MIRIHTNHGLIELELDANKAPATVENFLQYVNDGFFDGTIFHRVIKNFMVQGGGLTPDMKTKATREPVKNEANNGLKNERGSIAMARTSDPDSATAQFFINVVDNAFLNYRSSTADGWGYCVFGRVSKGMDIVDAIRAVATTTRGHYQDVPSTDVVIEKMEVISNAAN